MYGVGKEPLKHAPPSVTSVVYSGDRYYAAHIGIAVAMNGD
jgi:hypothetical protein